MNYYDVSMVGNVGKYRDVLTYQHPDRLDTGTLVNVPVGQRTSLGVVVGHAAKPDFACKDISRVAIERPLPSRLVQLHHWMVDYYATSSGDCWQSILPAKVTTAPRAKALPPTIKPPRPSSDDCTHYLLNACQRSALAQIRAEQSGTILLHGITGSGKTEVYKELTGDALNSGQSVIMLVPEISLTAQLVGEFQRRFPEQVVVTHSAMTASQRNLAWRNILFSTKPLVIIGPRSALFMPVTELGLVIIDECHEPSYHQDQSPRYSTVTVASKLAQLAKCRLILGSATPSVSDYYLAEHLHRPIVTMDQLAKPDAIRPTTKIVDLTKPDNFRSESDLFTTPLLTAMRQALGRHRQVLLFHNRRGTAGLALCQNCGWTALCPNCFTPLTLHHDKYQLICHICGHHQRPPLVCPDCHQPDLTYKGIGTKRIEEEVRRLFPAAKLRRFDGDTLRGEAVQDVYHELRDGTTDIIIGTQTIAKGLDLPHLAVVGIVQADAGLSLPDFSAGERTFQLIAQACGRVGRGNQATTAIIQTYQPQAPAVRYGANQDYAKFYKEELARRRQGHFPPFSYLLQITCNYKTERGATTAISRLAGNLRQRLPAGTKLLGPSPAWHERTRSGYRWQIVIRSGKRHILVDIAKQIKSSGGKWQVKLDPISLL